MSFTEEFTRNPPLNSLRVAPLPERLRRLLHEIPDARCHVIPMAAQDLVLPFGLVHRPQRLGDAGVAARELEDEAPSLACERLYLVIGRLKDPRISTRSRARVKSVCVWELKVQAFEREAWLLHVLQNQDGPDLEGYLAQGFSGNV